MVTALAHVKPTAGYGKQFIYNNVLIGSGGYALGVAAGGGSADLGIAYDTAMRERVLAPIGMDAPRSILRRSWMTATMRCLTPLTFPVTSGRCR